MPVTIENITSIDPHERADLIKIGHDAADGKALTEIIDRLGSCSHRRLFIARFNSRIIAAAIIEPCGESWNVVWLCVRTITRGRGVARRLLTELNRLATEAGRQLTLPKRFAGLAGPQTNRAPAALAVGASRG